MKFGAVGFVVVVPTTFVINFQLAAGVWILQTLPAVFLGAASGAGSTRGRSFAGWAVGTALGTLPADQGRASPRRATTSAWARTT